MFRKAIFQVHWLLGLTAGAVLMVVGISGALLSCKDILLQTSGILTQQVSAGERALDPSELLRILGAQIPEHRVVSIAFASDPKSAARVTTVQKEVRSQGEVRAEERGKPAPPRRERRYVDPYTGTLLESKSSVDTFFSTAEKLHRNLAAGPTGRMLVGASTIVLVFLTISGLYLRWPRRMWDWRVWLKMSFKLRGRALWIRLHSVIGTWMLLSYLLAALSGLYFAYPWYRTALVSLIGAHPPSRSAVLLVEPSAGAVNLDLIWNTFRALHVNFVTVEIAIPERSSQAAEIRYLPIDAPHERAVDRLIVHPSTGAVLRHERFVDKNVADRFIGSMLPLHSGAYFGMVGLIFTMVASFAMPLFYVSGWILYIGRRRRAHSPEYPRESSSMLIDAK